MAKPYSIDLRQRAVAAVLKEGLSRHESAARFGVAPSTVINGCDGLGRRGASRPAGWAGTSPRRSPASTRPFWRGGSGTAPSPCADWWPNWRSAALRSIIGRFGISFTPRSSASKKTVVASERDRPDVARRRAQWTKRQSGVDPKRLVFIDETWTKTNMEPLRGWAPKGERLVAKVPHGHWQTMTFVAALRHDRIEAPWLIDGPINGEGFRTYVEKALAPTLKPGELCWNLGDGVNQAADFSWLATSIPSRNVTPRTSFGN